MTNDIPHPFIVIPRLHAASLVYKLWGLETVDGEREELAPKAIEQLARLFKERKR